MNNRQQPSNQNPNARMGGARPMSPPPTRSSYTPMNNGGNNGGNSTRSYQSKKSPTFFIVVVLVLALVLTVSSFITGFLLANKNKVNADTNSLPFPNLELDIANDLIKWNAIVGAVSYTLYVDNTEHKDIRQTQVFISEYVPATSDIVTLRVKAIGRNDSSSDFSNSVWYKKDGTNDSQLSVPSGLRVENGFLVWNLVDGANKYNARVKQPNSQNDTSIEVANNRVDLSVYTAVGNYEFGIQAVDTSGSRQDSNWASYNYLVSSPDAVKLDTPTNLGYSSSTKTMTWDSVANASGYRVFVATQSQGNLTFETSTNSQSAASINAGQHSFTVVATGDGTNYADSSVSSSFAFEIEQSSRPALDTPALFVVDAMLNWTEVAGAVKYSVDIDGTVKDTTDVKYDLSGLTQNKTYVLKVKAIADPNTNSDSAWSAPYNYLPGTTLSGETSPDAVESRIKALLPRETYEEMFPMRFGSEPWKDYGYWYYAPIMDQITDYYSYDNLIAAARLIAGKKIKIQFRQNSDGSVSYYAARIVMIDKVTNNELIVQYGADWDADWNINKPVITYQEVDLGSFMLAKDPKDSKRDLAAFLAHKGHETGGGNLLPTWTEMETGLFYNEEVGWLEWDKDPDNPTLGYVDTQSTEYPAQPGQSYHGRGAAQLSWNYNYGLVSGILFGDKMVLLKNADMVLDMDMLGVASALVFWMVPQLPKAGSSEVMTNTYVLNEKDIAAGRQLGFGLTIIIINGGLEQDLDESDGRIHRRISFYRKFTTLWGVDITGEKLDTKGMFAWT